MRCRVLQIRQGSAWFVHELDQVIIGPRAKLAFLNFFFEPGNLDWWHFRFWGAKSSLAPAGRSTARSRKRSKRSFYGLTLSLGHCQYSTASKGVSAKQPERARA